MVAVSHFVAAPSAAGAQSYGVECPGKEFRVLYWPSGHAALPALNEPESAVPHVEVYRGTGGSYESDQYVVSISPDEPATENSCVSEGHAVRTKKIPDEDKRAVGRRRPS